MNFSVVVSRYLTIGYGNINFYKSVRNAEVGGSTPLRSNDASVVVMGIYAPLVGGSDG